MTSPARRAAHRHKDEIGHVLAIHHDRPGPRTVIGFAVAWVRRGLGSLSDLRRSPVVD